MKKIFILTGLIFSLMQLPAKNLGLDISYAQYMTDNDQSYLELYFALKGSTLTFAEDPAGRYQGGVEVTVTFTRDSTINAADRFRILSPVLTDTSGITGVFIQQERFELQPGSYILHLKLADINNPSERYDIKQHIEVQSKGTGPSASDLLFLDSYRPASQTSKYAKSGYELIPLVSSGTYFFPDAVSTIPFYLELYNINDAIGEGNPYLLKYFLKDADNNDILNKYASFSKKEARDVQPVLASFDISNLPTGNYNLIVQALDTEGEIIVEKKQFFFRRSDKAKPLVRENLSADINGTFADKIDNFDSLYLYIRYLYPISSEREQNYQQALLREQDKDEMKRYFYSYWLDKNPDNPEGEWHAYHTEVKIANKLYGTKIQRGYMSNRGRVYLVYGRPDLVEERRFEPSLPPYEIWQYNNINSKYAINQSNKLFIFAEFNASTNDYELIHSTALGELYNRRWQYDLAKGYYGVGGDVDANRINSGNDFGSRLNNNIIFQSGQDSGNR